MEMIKENDLKILYSSEQIQEKIIELAAKLNKEYKDEELYLIYVFSNKSVEKP